MASPLGVCVTIFPAYPVAAILPLSVVVANPGRAKSCPMQTVEQLLCFPPFLILPLKI